MYRKDKNEKDVLYILENLKPEDKKEAITIKGENYKEIILKEIMSNSSITYLGCQKDDTPICVGGYTDTETSGIGVVWLLSTLEVEKNKIALFRNILDAMKEIDEKYYFTYNFLYKENYFAKKWLKKIGYKFNNPKPAGLNIPNDFEFFYRVRKTRGL